MKRYPLQFFGLLLILSLSMVACGQLPPLKPKPVDFRTIDTFWPAFQEAITMRDTATLSGMIHFPLDGAAIFAGRFDNSKLQAKEFFPHYDAIFDPLARERITNTPADDLILFAVGEDAYSASFYEEAGIEEGEALYRLDVLYIDQEEGDPSTTTESSVSYCFARIGDYFRLCRILAAG